MEKVVWCIFEKSDQGGDHLLAIVETNEKAIIMIKELMETNKGFRHGMYYRQMMVVQ